MKKGFTLLELLIVIIILGIIVAIAMVRYGNLFEYARSAEAYSVLAQIVAAEKRYYLEQTFYTTNISKLDSFDAVPISNNFNFSIASADASSGYAQAARNISAADRNSYCMCLKSAKKIGNTSDTCNPGCP